VNLVVRPRARDDIIQQFRWYLVKQDAPDAAFLFLDAVDESTRDLLRMPNMGAKKALKNPALEGL
jgi:plasmid stabilization system protein ParE